MRRRDYAFLVHSQHCPQVASCRGSQQSTWLGLDTVLAMLALVQSRNVCKYTISIAARTNSGGDHEGELQERMG